MSRYLPEAHREPAAGPEPGQTAFIARFLDDPSRVCTWEALPPDARAVWARVEAACSSALPAEPSASAGAGWRSIASAPRTGTPILVAYVLDYMPEEKEHFQAVCWWTGSLWSGGPAAVPGFRPEAWQPLPAAPGTQPAPVSVEPGWRPSEEQAALDAADYLIKLLDAVAFKKHPVRDLAEAEAAWKSARLALLDAPPPGAAPQVGEARP